VSRECAIRFLEASLRTKNLFKKHAWSPTTIQRDKNGSDLYWFSKWPNSFVRTKESLFHFLSIVTEEAAAIYAVVFQHRQLYRILTTNMCHCDLYILCHCYLHILPFATSPSVLIRIESGTLRDFRTSLFVKGVRMPIFLVGFANLAHMVGTLHYVPVMFCSAKFYFWKKYTALVCLPFNSTLCVARLLSGWCILPLELSVIAGQFCILCLFSFALDCATWVHNLLWCIYVTNCKRIG